MKKLLLLFGMLLLTITTYAQNDWESWLTLNISGNISERFKVILEGEDRYRHVTNQIKYFHYDIGLTYKLSQKAMIGAFYREIYYTSNIFRSRLPQPHVDFFWKEPFGFKFRGRLEYQMFEDLEHQFRLRLRPGWQFSFWDNFNPYVLSEIFFNQKYNLTRNRFSAGLTINYGNIQIQPNYTLEHNNKSVWTNRDVFWINTKFKF